MILGPGRASDHDAARRALIRRRRRRRLRMLVGWGLVAVVSAAVAGFAIWGGRLGVAWLAENTRLLEVERVDVETPRWVPPWEVAELSGVSPGDDIISVDPDTVMARVAGHPRVAAVEVRRGWDRTVRVEIVERAPLALLHGARVLEVSADGTLLGAPPAGPQAEWPIRRHAVGGARGFDLPLLTGVPEGNVAPGARLAHEGARQALAFLARLREYDRPGEGWISEIWAAEPGNLLLVTLEEGMPVRIGDGRLTRLKVEALWGVLEQIRRESPEEDRGPVQVVDARFRNQVVVKRS